MSLGFLAIDHFLFSERLHLSQLKSYSRRRVVVWTQIYLSGSDFAASSDIGSVWSGRVGLRTSDFGLTRQSPRFMSWIKIRDCGRKQISEFLFVTYANFEIYKVFV